MDPLRTAILPLVAAAVLAIAGHAPAQANPDKPSIEGTPWVFNSNTSFVLKGKCPNANSVTIYKKDLNGLWQPLGGATVTGQAGNGADRRFERQFGTNQVGVGCELKVVSDSGGSSEAFTVRACPDRKVRAPGGSPPAAASARMSFFDVVAIRAANVRGLDVCLESGTHAVQILVLAFPGTFAGRETSPSAWQPLGAATVTALDATSPVSLPFAFDVPLPAGQRRGFCLEVLSGNALATRAVASASTQVAGDCDLGIEGGTVSFGHFTSPAAAAVFRGDIWYRPSAAAPCAFQRNHGAAWLDIDGVESNGVLPAVTGGGASGGATLWVSPLALGMPYDLAVTLAPVIAWPSPGALATPGAQVINLDLAAPGLFFLNGGAAGPAPVPSPGTFTLPLPASSPTLPPVVSAQMFVLDPGSPDGVALSQAVQHAF